MRLTFRLCRFNPETGDRSSWQDFRLDIHRGMTVLEALIRIKNELDGTLSFRYSCRSAICGSCAMDINGSEKLACRTSVRHEFERHGQVMVRPLRNMPVIKDLIVDMSPFWGKIRSVTPWLSSKHAVASHPSGQMIIFPSQAQFHNVDACIMCGACVAACTTHEVSPGFLGPAALAKADRFLADPREPGHVKRFRLEQLQDADGMWDCTRCNFCVQVCPKDVKPMEAIIRLRRASLEEGLTQTGGARHIAGFRQLIEQEGRLNEALMPLKVVGFDISRLVQVGPLGLRMLVRGKVPNPFGHAIPGIEQVRAIFRAVGHRRRTSQSAAQ
jgi:succinate dehydrogenase / fumarate reductase iron-sulfur subunit